jgi:ADP-heptose:LPS heptosyltransferase
MCALPALAQIKSVDPYATVTLIGLEPAMPLVNRYSDLVDEFITFPGFPGIPEMPRDAQVFTEFLKENRGKHDVCLQMHGSGAFINEFCLLLGAKKTALTSKAASAVTDFPDLALTPFSRVHETERLMAVVAAGFGTKPAEPRLPWFATRLGDHKQASGTLGDANLRRPYVVLHPGAMRPERRWPAEKYVAIGAECLERGYEVVLTGSENEAELCGSIANAIGPQARSAAGLLDIGGTAAVLERSSFVIANDTGIAHLTAALGVPLVVIYMSSDARRWAPRGAAPVIQLAIENPQIEMREDRFGLGNLIEPDPADVLRAIAQLGPLAAPHSSADTGRARAHHRRAVAVGG